jgi:mevalonate pyrophosphate decarboxylase
MEIKAKSVYKYFSELPVSSSSGIGYSNLSINAESPINIALVKYWGKLD